VSGPLDGRLAVVTGAFGRLGPVWCRALLEAGADVLAVDLAGQALPDDLRAWERNGRLTAATADVRRRDELEAVLNAHQKRVGAPHILVNNAGIDQPPGKAAGTTLEHVPFDEFMRVLEVNVAGAFCATQVFGGPMAAAGRGSIINVGSLYASVSPDARFYDHIDVVPPFLKPPAYGASKAALANLTKYFATHWGPSGVRVNTLSPGGVLGGQDPEFRRKFTARVPLGRMAEHSDLTGPLLFLASDASSYVTGSEIRVDGGFCAW